MAAKPTILCILDGWGAREDRAGNAPALAQTPVFDHLMATCPNAQLITHGPDAGLPTGQMGNSEVGHTNIGAGRVVAMDLGQIDLSIEDGSFLQNPAILGFARDVRAKNGVAHVMGLVSDGGVHGQLDHMLATVNMLVDQGLKVVIHAITDGRDVAPRSADGYMDHLTAALPDGAQIGTVTGRYYAMDRDNRWERVKTAFDAMIHAQGQTRGQTAPTPAQAITQSYAQDVTDEFIPATVIAGYTGVKDGDGIFCLNFRADRAREILAAIGAPDFDGFDTGTRPHLSAFLGMVSYSDRHDAYMQCAFPKRDIPNTLGEWVSKQGLRQFRLAETEKYPHVTFFLNGGVETPWPGEDRHMPPSPKVATYDLQPEMAADQVRTALVQAIHDRYDLIVVNFANPDMVGHTGDLDAAIKACEVVDQGVGAAVEALRETGGAMIVTADHGNCETMTNPDTGAPHTAHTTNPVPVILFGGPDDARLRNGRLADLAPTILELMGQEVPVEMTGQSLIVR